MKNPDLILCSISLGEIESQLNTLLSSLVDGDRSKAMTALALIQEARHALSDKTEEVEQP